MTRMEEVAKLLNELYKKDKPDSKFVQCVVDTSSNWDNLFFTDQRRISKKPTKHFHVKDIIPVSSGLLPSFSTGVQLKGKELTYAERTGLYKIEFGDGSFMYIGKWFCGIGRNKTIESMFATEGMTWVKFLNMTRQARIRKVKPKVGAYRVHIDQRTGGVVYEKFKKIPNNEIYHDELPVIKKNVNYYFDNVESFMKFNQAGRRTMLLYGEPGTSKTSTLYKLALEHKDNKSVVFATDIAALAGHVAACEKYNIPTLAFFEDAESALKYNDSNVKNFLSGIHAKQNKGGTCIIYTTNYPEQIEESIKERPERVDELYYIGPITGKLLVACAKFYFGTFAPSDNVLENTLTKPMTGAEVKLFVENTLRYCASNRCEIDKVSMDAVLKNYRTDIKKLQQFSEGKPKTYVKSSNTKEFGFAASSDDGDFNNLFKK